MSDGSDEKGSTSKPGAEPEPRRRVRARQPTLLGVAAPSLAATIASVAKDASAAPPPKPAAAPPKPASGLGKPGVPRPAAALGRTLTGSAAPSGALKREPARSEALPPKLARPKIEPPKSEKAEPTKAEPTRPATPARVATPPKTSAPATREPANTEPAIEAAEIADLEETPTHVGAAPASPDAPAVSGFGGPALESAPFAGPVAEEEDADELAGESTQVAAAQPDPSLDAAPDLPFEPTMPAAKLPEAPPEAAVEEPVRETPPPKELAVEPTVVVHPSLTSASKPETYRFDVRSGVVERAPEADEAPPKKSGSVIVLAVLGGVAALLVVGIGITAVLLVTPDDPEIVSSVATGPAVVDSVVVDPVQPVANAAGEPDPGPATAAPVPEAAEEETPTEGGEGDETEPEAAGDEEPPPVTGAVVPRAEIDAYDLDEPRLSRRARRMPEAERRRHALRLRNVGLRLYREQAYAEAEASFRQGLEHLPRDAAACEGLARAIAQQSRFPEAIAWASLAVERSSRSAASYRVLGDIWRQAGHPDEAARAYRRGLARDPTDRWLRRRLRELD